MPFPLPQEFSFGFCGLNPPGIPGCSRSVQLAPVVRIRCAGAESGCSQKSQSICQESMLMQQTFTRYAARLGHAAPKTADEIRRATTDAFPKEKITRQQPNGGGVLVAIEQHEL
eukprot:m.721388 g.721388  ORF g.721388 m.721388 type:complete len:114 (+) comp23013_c0_seq12:1578-1919(+)